MSINLERPYGEQEDSASTLVTLRAGRSGKPFLRWAGSKRKLIPILKSFWRPDHQRYIEPFAGSACLFFAIAPPCAILGDVNEDLIQTYLEVKYRLQALLTHLDGLGPSDKTAYLTLRAQDPNTLTKSAQAARFLYLNRFCFNGIYRTNRAGAFNVPFSGNGCGSMPNHDFFRDCASRLKNTRFVNKDFDHVLKYARPGDLVYLDPPYATNSRRIFREYHPDAFTASDVERLRLWMEKMDCNGVNFVVSYAESPEADFLKRGFLHEVVELRRNVSGFAAHRRMANELLISNTARSF